MGEIIGHLFGSCGEGHPHLLNTSPIIAGAIGYFSILKFKIKSLCKKHNPHT
jgi:hypothetical protein